MRWARRVGLEGGAAAFPVVAGCPFGGALVVGAWLVGVDGEPGGRVKGIEGIEGVNVIPCREQVDEGVVRGVGHCPVAFHS
jgi:hypothetical protein